MLGIRFKRAHPGRDREERRETATGIAWVTSDIAVAGAPGTGDWRRIAAAGVRSVVEVRSEAADDATALAAAGLPHRRFAIDEGSAPAPAELAQIAGWIADRIGAGPVLVHCREGRGRSVLAACAALILLGHAPAAAYDLVRKARPAAALSERQIDALTRYAAAIRAEE